MGRGGIYAPRSTLSTLFAGSLDECEQFADYVDKLEITGREHAPDPELLQDLVISCRHRASEDHRDLRATPRPQLLHDRRRQLDMRAREYGEPDQVDRLLNRDGRDRRRLEPD